MLRMWHLYLTVIFSVVISTSNSFNKDAWARETDIATNKTFSEVIGNHRVIKRFTPQFSFPKPKLPSLPRPGTFIIPLPIFTRGHPKGEDGQLPKPNKKNRRPRPRPHQDDLDKDTETSGSHEDRTLIAANLMAGTLAAKKALLLKKAVIAKKAIILAKIAKSAKAKKKKVKKWKKKAALATAAVYGLKKASKIKGLTVKTPIVQLSLGPTKAGAEAVAAEEAAVAEEDEDALSFLNAEDITEEDISNSTETGDTDTKVVSTYDNDPEEPITMMQQLQQQLLEKQQQQQAIEAQLQQQKVIEAQQQQQQQQQVIEEQTPPPPEIYAGSNPEDPDEPELYKGSKGKKAKKKAKGKLKARPVNLGVKANIYKKFDDLAKQAHKGISTFIQIDVDFLRSSIDDIIEPGRFVSRTAKLPSDSKDSVGDLMYVKNVQVPGNFFPPWIVPTWKSEYPKEATSNKGYACGKENGCVIKPIYVLLRKMDVE